MTEPAWVATIATVAAADWLCDRNGLPTISSTTRHVLRTDTRTGRLVVVAGWSALTAWFVPHLLRGTDGLRR